MKRDFHHPSRSGFTLIELSIVLVIIGLLVGGVLVGRDLIRAAEIRKLVSATESYRVAVNTFRLKYDCMPGDCAEASQILSGVIDGNGDGYFNELNLFNPWEQLSIAGLVAGKLTRSGGPNGPNDAVLGVNTPDTGVRGIGCVLVAFSSALWGPGYFPQEYQNTLLCGKPMPNDMTTGGGLGGYELSSIDRKLDDGRPGTGKVRTIPSLSFTTTTTDPATAEYLKTAPTSYGDLLILENGK